MGLALRMIAAIGALVVVTIGFIVGVWAVFYGVLRSFEVDVELAVQIAVLASTVTLLLVGYLEYTQLRTIERLADARPVDPQTQPELYRIATNVAAQLDISAPTIALSESDAPEAMAVGLRPQNMHLVLSTGTLEALEGPNELEAVIAHELAHVKNRDAMVMTVVSLPVILADGMRSRIARVENPGWLIVVYVPLQLLATVVWVIGRTITARVSRVREHAADRVAAEITGSPATVASVLQRLDDKISETPEHDLREVSGVSSLSILPLEPEELEKIMLGPDGDIEPSYWWLESRLHRLERRLFGTHPPTEDRVDRLSNQQREHGQKRIESLR